MAIQQTAIQQHISQLRVSVMSAEVQHALDLADFIATSTPSLATEGLAVMINTHLLGDENEVMLRAILQGTGIADVDVFLSQIDDKTYAARIAAKQEVERKAKIAELQAQLDALTGSAPGKPAAKKATAKSTTPTDHDLLRKLYGLGYTVKTRAVKAGASEAEAERQAVEAKVAFAREHGLSYTPSTPLAAPVEEAKTVEDVQTVVAESLENISTELTQAGEEAVEADTTEVQTLLDAMGPEVAALPVKKSRKASK